MIENLEDVDAVLAPLADGIETPMAVGLSSTKAGSRNGKSQKPKNRSSSDGPTGKAVTARRADTKTEAVLKKLRLARGATVEQIMEATGWQVHSVRGFLSAVIRTKLGLNLVSDVGTDSQRRYRVVATGDESA
jgi:hypothetical protein